MLTIRLFIKKNFPNTYTFVRSGLFPLYYKLKGKKRSTFTQKTVFNVNHSNESFKIVLDPQNGFVDTEIFTSGVYEPDILDLIKQNLKKGGTFVDIGANIGQHSLFAGSVVGSEGKVIAFEPIPQLVNQFSESVEINSFSNRCTIIDLACSDKVSETEIRIRPGNIGGSSLNHTDDTYTKIKIRTAEADFYLENQSEVSLIKIDTEGYEMKALLGLKKTLNKYRPKMIIEYSPSLAGEDVAFYKNNFFALLNTFNYKYFDIEDGLKEIIDTESWSNSFIKTQTNILCIAK